MATLIQDEFKPEYLKRSCRICPLNNEQQIEASVLRLWHNTKVQAVQDRANFRTECRSATIQTLVTL